MSQYINSTVYAARPSATLHSTRPASLITIQSSARDAVMESTTLVGAGPNAQHVIDPAATCVLPASRTAHATSPAASAASFNDWSFATDAT